MRAPQLTSPAGQGRIKEFASWILTAHLGFLLLLPLLQLTRHLLQLLLVGVPQAADDGLWEWWVSSPPPSIPAPRTWPLREFSTASEGSSNPVPLPGPGTFPRLESSHLPPPNVPLSYHPISQWPYHTPRHAGPNPGSGLYSPLSLKMSPRGMAVIPQTALAAMPFSLSLLPLSYSGYLHILSEYDNSYP